MKKEFLGKAGNEDVAFLSTNDVVMAALSEVHRDTDVSQLFLNMRGRSPDAKDNMLCSRYTCFVCYFVLFVGG